jgi:HEAT repeat protein
VRTQEQITEPPALPEDDVFPLQNLLSMLDDEDGGVQHQAIAALPMLAEMADHDGLPGELLARLFDASRCHLGREGLASVFAALFAGPDQNPALLGQLGGELDEHRAVAALALGSGGNAAVVPSLIESLDDESDRVFEAAVEALAAIADERAHKALLEVLEEEGLAAGRRAHVVAHLHQTDGAEAVLFAHLRHDDASVRVAALSALRQREELDSSLPLRACLADKDPRVRLLALSVLELHGDGGDLEAVEGCLTDSDPRVQQMARETLSALGGGRLL